MDCHAFRAAHLDLTDGTLAADEHAAALAHRDGCPECAGFDCRVRRSVLLVHNLPEVMPRPGFDARLRARIALHAHLDGRRRRRRAIVLTAAAAAASVAIVAGAWSVAAGRNVPMGGAAPVASNFSLVRAPALAPSMPVVRRDARAAALWEIPLWSSAITLDQTPARFAASGSFPLPSAR